MSVNNGKISVLIVDDHAVVREGYEKFLNDEMDIEVVGTAENGKVAIQKAIELTPHIIVMDIRMPIMNGLEASREIIRLGENWFRAPRIIILSASCDQGDVCDAVSIGVSGYFLKTCTSNDLVDAIRLVNNGRTKYCQEISSLIGTFSRVNGNRFERPTLTPREIDVLKCIADGLQNKQIAGTLGISKKTVEKHRQAIMKKLNIHDVANLTRFAINRRYVTVPFSPLQPPN